jgi:hypothetical protein
LRHFIREVEQLCIKSSETSKVEGDHNICIALHWPENMEIPAVNLKVKSVVNMFAIVVSHTYNADFIYTALT